MKKINIGIMGATGAVGQEMIKILGERNFPIGELRCLASERSEGKVLNTPFGEVCVQHTCETAFDGLDIVLGASENDIACAMAPHIKKAGAVFIDNSSAFRLEPDVPLVVPEINAEDALKHNGIISNPNCSTIITLVAVNAINQLSPIKAIYASTYQATSGAGAAGPREMFEQSRQILEGKTEVESRVFQHQIAYNLIPQIGGFGENGYSSEEMKLQNEGRKIMHLPELNVSCTCVRVPVERSHAISAVVITEDRLDLNEVRKAIDNAKTGIIPGGAYRNKDYVSTDVISRLSKDIDNDLDLRARIDCLYDPQTSGGLLIAINEKDVKTLTSALQEFGLESAIIGQFKPKESHFIEIYD